MLSLKRQISRLLRARISLTFRQTLEYGFAMKLVRDMIITSCSVKRKNVLKSFAKFTEKHLLWSVFFNEVGGWKHETFRRSHWRCKIRWFCKTRWFKNFANFTGNNLCCSLFLIKLHFWGLQLYQRRLQHRCFPVKFAMILKNICESLLLNFI